MCTCVLDKWGAGWEQFHPDLPCHTFLVSGTTGLTTWLGLTWTLDWIQKIVIFPQIGSEWVLLLIICICVWSSSLALSLLLKTYSWLSGRPPLYGNWFYNKADDAKPAVGLFYTALNALVDCKKLCFLFYSAFYALVDSGLQSSG